MSIDLILKSEYASKAREVGLPEHCVEAGTRLLECIGTQRQKPQQSFDSLLDAYKCATDIQDRFRIYFMSAKFLNPFLGTLLPPRLKTFKRSEEKYFSSREGNSIPLDLIACKLILPSLLQVYQVAIAATEEFCVIFYKDRFVYPQVNGYRDIQLILKFEGLCIEFKINHALMEAADLGEHSAYEQRRTSQSIDDLEGWGESPFGAPWGDPELTLDELREKTSLDEVGRVNFSFCWKEIIESESKGGH